MRNAQDVGVMINLLALNSWKHQIQILADCEMSTHVHLITIGTHDDASAFIKDVRRQYTRHMDTKYGRPKHIRFGEKGFFELDIYGNSHIQSALSYVLRNPMHHGVVFLRPCFEELRQTEMLFVSPGAFQFCMFRKSDENWLREQDADANGLPPIELSCIEPFSDRQTLNQFHMNERSSTFKRTAPTDFDVCRIVDCNIVPEFKCHSIYELNDSQKSIGRKLLVNELHITESQAERCIP